MRRKMLLIIFTIIMATACEDLTDIGSIENEYSFFIDLAVNQQNQKYYIYNAYSLEQEIAGYPFGSNDDFFVDNPYIEITDENERIYSEFGLQILSGYINSKYISNLTDFNVLPDQEYKIKIEIEGRIWESKIKTLPKIENLNLDLINEYADDGSRYTESIISWNEVPDAKYYILDISIQDSEGEYDTLINPNDTLILPNFPYTKEYFYKEGLESYSHESNFYHDGYYEVSFSLKAYDFNAYQHFYKQNDQVNIKDAFGYIGSSSVIDTFIVFRD